MSVENIKPFKCKGQWWLPEKPDEPVSGILTYTLQEGASLELLGSFNDSVRGLTETFAPEIVLGASDQGLVTLHDCVQTQLTLGTTNSSNLKVRNVLLGYHFLSEQEINFEKIFVRYSNLDEWVNRSGFNKKALADEHASALGQAKHHLSTSGTDRSGFERGLRHVDSFSS